MLTLHSGTGAPGLGGREHTGGKHQASEDPPAASSSQDTAVPHCSPKRPGMEHREMGKATLQIQKWRVEIKACNCRVFSCRDFPLSD